MTPGFLPRLLAMIQARQSDRVLAGAALLAALAPALLPAARAFAPEGSPGAEAAAAAGPVSTAATGARCIGPAFDDTPAFQAAIDTGHTVYAPALGGQCHITRPLVMKTPGQVFHGDGRARTKIAIQPGFAGAGVFVAKTGGPGPVWRDVSVSFVQPDTDDRARLTRYPPAFYVPDTPGFAMDHVGCYAAWTCVDMKGNSGGATIADLQMSALELGIDIDGSLDTVRITDPHWWPFGLTKGQQTIFMDQGQRRPIALKVGRMDDLIIRGGLFLGGLAISLSAGKTGTCFGTIDGTDFDSTSGIVMEAGSLQIAASVFTLGVSNSQAIEQTGGSSNLGSSTIFVGVALDKPAISLSGGSLTITGTHFQSNSFDVTSVGQTNAALILNSNVFARAPNIPYQKPTIEHEDGRIVAVGNYATDKGVRPGVFIRIGKDDAFNKILGNSSPGWTYLLPRQRLGTYALD